MQCSVAVRVEIGAMKSSSKRGVVSVVVVGAMFSSSNRGAAQ